MFRRLLLLGFVSDVLAMGPYHQVYMSRRSRSNSAPNTGYIYSQFNNYPILFSTFEFSPKDKFDKSWEKYYPSESKLSSQYSAPLSAMKTMGGNVYYTTSSPSQLGVNYEISKSEAKYNSNLLRSKMKTDAMYERLKSVMHYDPADGSDAIMVPYGHGDEYNLDDEDVRSSSRSSYDSWPYYYHSPYEYEHMKIDSQNEKSKDKRYAVDTARSSIPVHEDLDGDPLNTFGPLTTERSNSEFRTDNPIIGDSPFFSFVLNDYFDRSKEDATFDFKGLDWGNDFDQGSSAPEIDDYLKRTRRLENNYDWKPMPYLNDGTLDSLLRRPYEVMKTTHREGLTDTLADKTHNYINQDTGDQERENHNTQDQQTGNKHEGFKEFADVFAKKFGSEDHKKDSKYLFKRNQDKGEKKKGFRKVYNKNEYQEEDEFYDNNNSSTKAQEKGQSSTHTGGAEAVIGIHANGMFGNKNSAYNKNGNTANSRFKNNDKHHRSDKEFERQFNNYRDVAKKAAQSNDDDYTEHIRGY